MKRREFLQGSVAIGALALAGCRGAEDSADVIPDEFVGLDGLAQADLVKNGEVTAGELVDAAITRIERLNPEINAVVTTAYDEARERAATMATDGRFGGVPHLIKDLADIRRIRRTSGSRLFEDNIAAWQSPYHDAVEESGLVTLGKSNTPEFGLLATTEPLLLGECRNPWNTGHSTGGSSGGAAAAVAAGMVPLADASDGGGSIRIPAACCGLFGLKPTRGRFPQQSQIAPPGEISISHPVTRSVRDSAAMLALTQDQQGSLPQTGEVTEASGEARRIAFSMVRMDGSDPDPDVVAATENAGALCEELGHEIVEVTPPIMGDEFIQRFLIVWASGPAQLVAMAEEQTGTSITESQLLEPWTIGLATFFAEQTAENPDALEQSLAYFRQVEAEMEAFFEGYDLWLTPTLASAPPAIGEQAPTVDFETLWQRTTQYVAYTPQHNVAGTPAMSVPLNWNDAELPIGTQIAAAKGNEAMLLDLAYQLEEARPWAERWAPVSAMNQ